MEGHHQLRKHIPIPSYSIASSECSKSWNLESGFQCKLFSSLLSVPDKTYSWDESCALYLISNFILDIYFSAHGACVYNNVIHNELKQSQMMGSSQTMDISKVQI